MTLKFVNQTIIKDVDGNNLSNEQTSYTIPFFVYVLTDADKADAESQSFVGLLSIILTFVTSLLITVVLGGTIEATWLLLGTLQLMSFIPLLNMNLPNNFREFSKNLAILHGEPAMLPNAFEYLVSSEGLQPYNKYFELMSKFLKISNQIDFKTTLLLLNSGRKIGKV